MEAACPGVVGVVSAAAPCVCELETVGGDCSQSSSSIHQTPDFSSQVTRVIQVLNIEVTGKPQTIS